MVEKSSLIPRIMIGPRGRPTSGGALFNTGDGPNDDGLWHVMFASNEATPSQSYYLHTEALPSKLIFGVNGQQPQYLVQGLTI